MGSAEGGGSQRAVAGRGHACERPEAELATVATHPKIGAWPTIVREEAVGDTLFIARLSGPNRRDPERPVVGGSKR
jgi:hypothetical protein